MSTIHPGAVIGTCTSRFRTCSARALYKEGSGIRGDPLRRRGVHVDGIATPSPGTEHVAEQGAPPAFVTQRGALRCAILTTATLGRAVRQVLDGGHTRRDAILASAGRLPPIPDGNGIGSTAIVAPNGSPGRAAASRC